MLDLVLFKKVYSSISLAQEYVILDKVAGIVANKKFMAMLSDRSQARETNDKIELALVRIKK